VTETPDPLAGSYYVESLTNGLEAAANISQEIEALGGTLAAIEAGYQQRQIQESAYQVQRAVENGTKVVVGVNSSATRTRPRRHCRRSIRRRTSPVRASGARADRSRRHSLGSRDGPARGVRRGEENLLPPMVEAVKAYATVGEVCDRLRSVWGEHRELITV